MLIVRDAFDGLRRFGEFQASLGAARNILSDRLRTLVKEGVLEIAPASDGSAYQEYVLTAKGETLFPVVVALRQWGEAHLYARGEKHSVLVDRTTGKPLSKALLRREDGRVIRPADTLVKKVRGQP